MSKEYDFLIFCIETYIHDRKIDGDSVFTLFTKYGVVKYILDNYLVLHSMPSDYILNDIDELVQNNNHAFKSFSA